MAVAEACAGMEDVSPASGEHRPVGSFISSAVQVPPTVKVSDAAEMFFQSPHLDAAAVVESGEPVGLITRQKFLLMLFRRFGFEIYGKKPVIALADTQPLIIDEKERLDAAIDKALERRSDMVYDEIIVTSDQGCFRGLLSMRQLVFEQSSALASSVMQKEMADRRARELERINQVKSQFIAHVTHELRSPVNAIMGLAELLRMAGEKGRIDLINERLSLMLSSAANLRAIITNILDLSKIEAGKMDISLDRFDLAALVHEIAETTRILVIGKPVTVQVAAPSGPVIITSDSMKLRRILVNLTSNAAKFTEQGSIRLSLSLGEDGIEIAVADTGIGIRQADLQRLFNAFSQLEDAKTKRYEGTGLGLTISRSLAQVLGGGITVSSVFGSGTVFTVTLPRQGN